MKLLYRKTLRRQKLWSSRRMKKEFPQKGWSRASLNRLVQKNWCSWYDWQAYW